MNDDAQGNERQQGREKTILSQVLARFSPEKLSDFLKHATYPEISLGLV